MSRFLLLLLAAGALGACERAPSAIESTPAEESPIALDVAPPSTMLCQGMEQRFNVSIAWLSEDPAPYDPPQVTWESLTPGILTVEPNGIARTHAPGDGVLAVVARWPGMEAREEVTVSVMAGQPTYEGGREVAKGIVMGGSLKCVVGG
jgi:hypothetical protein